MTAKERRALLTHKCPLCDDELRQLEVAVDLLGMGWVRFWCEGCGATLKVKDPTLASSLGFGEATLREAERKERMKTARKDGKR